MLTSEILVIAVDYETPPFSLCDSGNLTDTKLSRECPRRDLNPRPLPYQGSALPLSYKGNFKVGRVGFEPT